MRLYTDKVLYQFRRVRIIQIFGDVWTRFWKLMKKKKVHMSKGYFLLKTTEKLTIDDLNKD